MDPGTVTGGVYVVTPAAGGITSTLVAKAGFKEPLDSVPTSDGSLFYFVAAAGDGKPAVYSVPAAGGIPTPRATGAPLVTPIGISISTDDKTIYVADPSAGLFQLPAAGGTPVLFPGTDCMKPRGVDVARQGGVDVIYFTTSPGACGGTGLAKVAAAGGGVSPVATGAPFAVPTGVAVATNGDVYVANPAMDAIGPGTVVKVSGGAATEFVPGLTLGVPAGLALDLANTTLFVSGIDANGHDQVYSIALATKTIAAFNAGISENTNAGGVHRASGKDILSWADACPRSTQVWKP